MNITRILNNKYCQLYDLYRDREKARIELEYIVYYISHWYELLTEEQQYEVHVYFSAMKQIQGGK